MHETNDYVPCEFYENFFAGKLLCHTYVSVSAKSRNNQSEEKAVAPKCVRKSNNSESSAVLESDEQHVVPLQQRPQEGKTNDNQGFSHKTVRFTAHYGFRSRGIEDEKWYPQS